MAAKKKRRQNNVKDVARLRTPSREAVEFALLKLFPSDSRNEILTYRRVRKSGGALWWYLAQMLCEALYTILTGILANYLFERLRKGKKDEVIITEILERIPHGDIVEYRTLLKEASLIKRTSKDIPASVISIIERHREIEPLLSNAREAKTQLEPVLEETAEAFTQRRLYREPPKRSPFAFLKAMLKK